MIKAFRCLAIFLLGSLLGTNYTTAASAPFALIQSLFNPSTKSQSGAELGWSVAVDENLGVVGAPFDDVGGFDSGLVHVYDPKTGARLHTLANPNPASSEFFGYAVAISGTRVAVGAPYNDTGALDAGSVYVYDLASSTPAVPVATLNNPNPSNYDHFGSALAISSAQLVIGAMGDPTASISAGIAFVYDLSGSTPTVPVTILNNPSPAAGDLFGSAVAISGPLVVIGASDDDTGTLNAGSAYVYDLASVTPTVPIATLNDPSRAMFDHFGSAVAISRTRLVVGANAKGNHPGSAYYYDLASAIPTVPVASLNNPSPKTLDSFGISVGISGSRAVVGAYLDHLGIINAGGALVYELTGTNPATPVFALRKHSPAAGDYFGHSVAISGTQLLVGTGGDDASAQNGGSAYSFDLASTTPTVPSSTLTNSSPASGDSFGFSVAISGARAVIGVPFDDSGTNGAGNVHIYDMTSTTRALPVITLTNPIPALNEFFGWSVAISGARVVVGANRADNWTPNTSSAYVFDLDGTSPTIPMAKLTNPSPEPYDRFGTAVAISGTRVVVGAYGDDSSSQDAGSVYVYDLASVTPTTPVLTLTNPSPALNDGFGFAVGISATRVVIGASGDDTGANGAGSVYIYDLARATPAVPFLTLTNPSPVPGDSFGYSVVISETILAVGEPYDNTGAGDAGRVYVYDVASPTPEAPILTLTNPNPATVEIFGYSLGLSKARLAVGVPYKDFTGATNAGSTYVYDLASASPNMPAAILSNPSPAEGDKFGHAVAVDGTTVVAGVPYDDTKAADRGAAYIFGLTPALSILPADTGFATILWTPTNAFGFTLHYSDALTSTDWLDAPSGATNPVTIPAANGSRFYQLRSP